MPKSAPRLTSIHESIVQHGGSQSNSSSSPSTSSETRGQGSSGKGSKSSSSGSGSTDGAYGENLTASVENLTAQLGAMAFRYRTHEPRTASTTPPPTQDRARPSRSAQPSTRSSVADACWSVPMASGPGSQRAGESTYSALNERNLFGERERSTANIPTASYGYMTEPSLSSYFYGMDNALMASRASEYMGSYHGSDYMMFDTPEASQPPMTEAVSSRAHDRLSPGTPATLAPAPGPFVAPSKAASAPPKTVAEPPKAAKTPAPVAPSPTTTAISKPKTAPKPTYTANPPLVPQPTPAPSPARATAPPTAPAEPVRARMQRPPPTSRSPTKLVQPVVVPTTPVAAETPLRPTPHTRPEPTPTPTKASQRTTQFAHAVATPLDRPVIGFPEAVRTPTKAARPPVPDSAVSHAPYKPPSPMKPDAAFPEVSLTRHTTPSCEEWEKVATPSMSRRWSTLASTDANSPRSEPDDAPAHALPPSFLPPASPKKAPSPRAPTQSVAPHPQVPAPCEPEPAAPEPAAPEPAEPQLAEAEPVGPHVSETTSGDSTVTYPRILVPLQGAEAGAPTAGYMSRRARDMPIPRNLPPRIEDFLPQVTFTTPTPRITKPYREQRATRIVRPPTVPRPFPEGYELEIEAGLVGVFHRNFRPPAPQPNLEGPPLPPRQRTTLREMEARVGYYSKDIPRITTPLLPD